MMANSNLLLIHQGALGDFVAIFPAIMQLKKAYSRIDVLCQSQLGKLAAALGLAGRWFGLEGAHFASLFTDQVDPKINKLLRPYTNIVLFSFSKTLEQSLNRITEKRCHRISPKAPAQERIHIVAYVVNNLIKHRLLEKKNITLEKMITAIKGNTEAGQRIDQNKILIHPGAGSIRKRWPLADFLTIETRLKADNLKPEFIIGPAEGDLVNTLISPGDHVRRVHILAEILDLLALLRSAGGYIGNDSGVSHLAAFLGLPATVIFGPADPKRWTPSGHAVEAVRPDLGCDPCFESEKFNCPDPKCLIKTRPDEVLEAFYRVYQRCAQTHIVGCP